MYREVTIPIYVGKHTEKGRPSSLWPPWLPQFMFPAKCLAEKVLSELLVKYNTAVPSGAAVERFFSQGKDKLKEKRATLSDETFEMLVFMRCNKYHLRNISDA